MLPTGGVEDLVECDKNEAEYFDGQVHAGSCLFSDAGVPVTASYNLD